MGGKFNDILYDSEKVGGNKINNILASNFLNCYNQLLVSDIYTAGPKHTWTNKRKESNKTREKLDRFLASENRRNIFPRAMAINSGFFGFDDRAVKLKLNHKT